MRHQSLFPGLVLALAAMGESRQAQDPDRRWSEEQLKRVQISIAQKRKELAKWLERKQLFKWARVEYGKAARLNPDDREDREKLGMVFEDGSWQAREGKGLPDENKAKPADLPDLWRAYWERLAALSKFAVKEMASLAKSCESRKLHEDARRCWGIVLDYDPDHADALSRLGYKRLDAAGPPLPPEARQFLTELTKGWKSAPAGEELSEETAAEKARSARHRKVRSDHFLVESSYVEMSELHVLTQLAENTFHAYHTFFGHSTPLVEDRITFLVLRGGDEYDRFVDWSYPDDEAKRKFLKGLWSFLYEGNRSVAMRYDVREHIRDQVVHRTAEALAVAQLGSWELPWIWETLAMVFARETVGAGTYCITMSGSTVAEAFKEPREWPKKLRGIVEEGKDDDFRDVMKSSLNDLRGPRGAKAWSVMDFLMKTRPQGMRILMSASRGDGTRDRGEAALGASMGWSCEELDEFWRRYVRQRY